MGNKTWTMARSPESKLLCVGPCAENWEIIGHIMMQTDGPEIRGMFRIDFGFIFGGRPRGADHPLHRRQDMAKAVDRNASREYELGQGLLRPGLRRPPSPGPLLTCPTSSQRPHSRTDTDLPPPPSSAFVFAGGPSSLGGRRSCGKRTVVVSVGCLVDECSDTGCLAGNRSPQVSGGVREGQEAVLLPARHQSCLCYSFDDNRRRK